MEPIVFEPMLSTRRPATYEDILALPPNQVGEIVDGTLYVHARPAIPHTRAASVLGGRLEPAFGDRNDPSGWIILDEPELHFGDDVVVPDLAGWRRTRMPELPQGAFIDLTPDWLCEVLAPSTEALDRGAKLRVYAHERVSFVWLVSPLARMLEVLILDGETYRIAAVHVGDTTERVSPFEALALDLGALWAR